MRGARLPKDFRYGRIRGLSRGQRSEAGGTPPVPRKTEYLAWRKGEGRETAVEVWAWGYPGALAAAIDRLGTREVEVGESQGGKEYP